MRTVGHQERGTGSSREPLQAALGETDHRAPSREVGEEGFRGGEDRGDGHAGLGSWPSNLCPPHSREAVWVVPCGRGDQCPVPNLDRAPEVAYTYKAPGAQAKPLVRCGVYRMKSQDVDGPCGGVTAVVIVMLQPLPRVHWLWKGGAASWVLKSCPLAWSPGGQEVQGATK